MKSLGIEGGDTGSAGARGRETITPTCRALPSIPSMNGASSLGVRARNGKKLWKKGGGPASRMSEDHCKFKELTGKSADLPLGTPLIGQEGVQGEI